MTRYGTIVGYTYSADFYCPRHIAAALAAHGHPVSPGELDNADAAEAMLDELAEVFCIPGAPGTVGLDREDEHTFDSGEFPKVVLAEMLDGTETCGGDPRTASAHPLNDELEGA